MIQKTSRNEEWRYHFPIKNKFKLRMKKYFILYKPFLLFLGTFFLAYIILTVLYQGYLNNFGENKIDSITKIVGKNTEQALKLFDAKADGRRE